MPDKPILLISGGATTRPLWKPLGEVYDLAFLYANAGQEAASVGISALPLAALMDGDLTETVENQAALLTAKVVNGLPAVSERMAQAFGHSAPPALNGHMGNWFAGYAHHFLLGEIAILAQLDKLAATGRHIAGCVTHEDVAPDTRALVAWANAHNLHTIHVPHAPCHLLPGVVDIHRETRTRYIAASGPAVARFYTDGGFPAENIRLTGAPHWDELYDGAIPGKREARQVMKVPDGQPVLMYQTTWGQTTSLRSEFEAEFERGFTAMLDTAQRLGAFLCVKIHWNDQRPDREEHYAKQMEAAGVDGLVTRQHYTYVMAASDVLVAQGPSNMCLDAAILGLPSVYITTEGFDFATSLPARCAPEGLLAAVTDTLANPPDLGTFIREYNCVHPDGDATAKVVAMVTELCA